MAKLYVELGSGFPCRGIDTDGLAERIAGKVLGAQRFKVSFRRGLVLVGEGLVAELSMGNGLDEDECTLNISCTVVEKGKIDICLAIASIALHELFTALESCEGEKPCSR